MAIRGSLIGLLAGVAFVSPAFAGGAVVLRGDIAFKTLETADIWNLEERRNPFASGEADAALNALRTYEEAVEAAKNVADERNAALNKDYWEAVKVAQADADKRTDELKARAEQDHLSCLASFADPQTKAAQQKCRLKPIKPVKPVPVSVKKAKPVQPAKVEMPDTELSQVDGGRLDGIYQAVLEHKAGPKPSGWDDKVEEIRAEPDFVRKLELADGYVDAGINYVGSRGSRWAITPYDAFTKNGLCRDYAVAKLILLTEAGIPAEDLRVVTVTDKGTGDPYHVLLLARDASGQVYLLDMLISDRALGGKAWKLSESYQKDRGVEWAGTLGGSITADRWHHKVAGIVASAKGSFLLADKARKAYWTATSPYTGYLVAAELGNQKSADAWLKRQKLSAANFTPLPAVKGEVVEMADSND